MLFRGKSGLGYTTHAADANPFDEEREKTTEDTSDRLLKLVLGRNVRLATVDDTCSLVDRLRGGSGAAACFEEGNHKTFLFFVLVSA